MAFALRVQDYFELLGATVEQTHQKCEYTCMVDERAGAAAVVVAEKRPQGNLK